MRALNLPGILTLAAVLAAWELAVRSGALVYDYLPAPSNVAVALAAAIVNGQIVIDVLHTLRSVLLGWAIAGGLGIGLGLLLGFSPTARRYGLATIETLRPMPGVAFLPLALLWFNFSLETELTVIVFPALWPIAMNTMGGVIAVEKRLHDVSRTLHPAFGSDASADPHATATSSSRGTSRMNPSSHGPGLAMGRAMGRDGLSVSWPAPNDTPE